MSKSKTIEELKEKLFKKEARCIDLEEILELYKQMASRAIEIIKEERNKNKKLLAEIAELNRTIRELKEKAWKESEEHDE